MTAAVRYDQCFGARGRVRAAKLFPLPSYTPGVLVLPGEQEMDDLYDEFARLLGQPDALDPESETAKKMAEVKAKLLRYQQAEATLMERSFEESLLLPMDAGAAFDEKLAKALAHARARAATDAAPSEP